MRPEIGPGVPTAPVRISTAVGLRSSGLQLCLLFRQIYWLVSAALVDIVGVAFTVAPPFKPTSFRCGKLTRKTRIHKKVLHGPTGRSILDLSVSWIGHRRGSSGLDPKRLRIVTSDCKATGVQSALYQFAGNSGVPYISSTVRRGSLNGSTSLQSCA